MKFLNIKMQKHYLYVKIKSGDKMYVLASDYDGTLKTRIHDLRINIKSLKKFRSLGNKFIIVTGRSFESIKKEIDEFEIPFDYLSCNDGAVSFNDSLEVIDAKYIKTINFETILYILKKYPGFHIENFYTPKTTSKTFDQDTIEIVIQGKQKPNHLIRELNESNFGCFRWRNLILVKEKCNKSDAIKFITSTFENKKIYTIGDEDNDIEMIKDFNGFRMLESSPSLWFTPKIVLEEHHLIKYLNFKSKLKR